MIGFAVIGTGAWGLNHVRAIMGDPRCALVAIADPSETSRENARALAPSAALYDDLRHAIANPAVEAVVIASPAPSHFALARDALLAGKHVLVEKPLAMRLGEALELAALSRERRVIGMVGHLMVYHPALLRLRELLHSGELGALRYLHSTRVNLGRIRRDENALWSFGPHDLSMFDFLTGQLPKTVTARGQCVLQPGVEDVVFLTLRYPNGEMAHTHLSWLNPRKERRLTLVCSSKMVEFDDMAVDKLRIFNKGYDRPPEFTEYAEFLTLRDGDVRIPQIAMQEPLRAQLGELVACIEGQRAPRTDLDSGVRVVRVLEAAQRSLERDGSPSEVQ